MAIKTNCLKVPSGHRVYTSPDATKNLSLWKIHKRRNMSQCYFHVYSKRFLDDENKSFISHLDDDEEKIYLGWIICVESILAVSWRRAYVIQFHLNFRFGPKVICIKQMTKCIDIYLSLVICWHAIPTLQ